VFGGGNVRAEYLACAVLNPQQEWYKHSARLSDRASQLPVLEHALSRLSRRLFFDSFSAASPRKAAPDQLVPSHSPVSNTASRTLAAPALPHAHTSGDPGTGSLRRGGAVGAHTGSGTMSGGGEAGGLRARDSNHGERVCGREVRGPRAMSPGCLSTLSTAASAPASVSSCGQGGDDEGGGFERSPGVGSENGDVKHVLVLSSDRNRGARACEQCEKLFTDNKRLFHDNLRLFRENKRLFHDNQRLFREAADLRRMSAQPNKAPSTDSPNGGVEGGTGISVSIKRGGRSLQAHHPSATRAGVGVAGTLEGGEGREDEAVRQRLSPQHPFSCEASFSAPASSPPASAASLAPTPEATASSTPELFARATDSLVPVEESRAPLEGGGNGDDGATLASAARRPPDSTPTSDPAAAPPKQPSCGGILQPLTARQVVSLPTRARVRAHAHAQCCRLGVIRVGVEGGYCIWARWGAVAM
jgi:hypothetical protein